MMQPAREIQRLLAGILVMLGLVGSIAAYWVVAGPETILEREDNPRLVEQRAGILRGSIVDRDGTVLVSSTETKPGTVIRETISSLDWFPTMLAVAGIERPEGVLIRGRSFLPLLRGEQVAWNNDLYAEYSMKHGAQTHMRAYRTPQWKLMIDFLNEGRMELYDLVRDPAETTNLADSQDPAILKVKDQLAKRIREQMRQLNDPALKQ